MKEKPKAVRGSGDTGEDDAENLPAEIREIMKAQENEAKLHEDVAMAILAAHALCADDLDGDEEDQDQGDLVASVSGKDTPCVAFKQKAVGRHRDPANSLHVIGAGGRDEDDVDDDDVDVGSIRSSDVLDEMAELEAQCETERQQRIDELEQLAAHHKKRALTLMKEGDKPAALVELRTAKEYEKEAAQLRPMPPPES
jgi:hypothetical protein